MKYDFDINQYRSELKCPLKAGRSSLDIITSVIEKEIADKKLLLSPIDFQTYLGILHMQVKEEITVQAQQNGLKVNIPNY